ncbi:hypothetical protein F4703DRAFT_1793899 [Phycomyces blakesleeanus]
MPNYFQPKDISTTSDFEEIHKIIKSKKNSAIEISLHLINVTPRSYIKPCTFCSIFNSIHIVIPRDYTEPCIFRSICNSIHIVIPRGYTEPCTFRSICNLIHMLIPKAGALRPRVETVQNPVILAIAEIIALSRADQYSAESSRAGASRPRVEAVQDSAVPT